MPKQKQKQSHFDPETSKAYGELRTAKWGGLTPTTDPVKPKQRRRRLTYRKIKDGKTLKDKEDGKQFLAHLPEQNPEVDPDDL